RLVHSDVVAAPSALFLPVLLIVLGIPFLLERKDFPDSSLPLILTVIVILIASAVSFFYRIPDYKGHDSLKSTLNAILTLFVGFGFYLTSVFRHDDEEKVKTTFRLLSISGAVVCLWTLLQAFFWYRDQHYPHWMQQIQFAVSVGSLYRQRFVGFTLEPSWLAHQLNLLYLPLWFAASVTGYSAFRFRLRFLTVERVLFAAGMLVLFLTLSRVGLAAFLITAAFAAIVFVRRLIRKLAGTFPEHRQRQITILAFLGVLIVLALAAYGILRLLMKLDFRMSELFSIDFIGRSDPLFYLAEKLSLAARFVYWDGGLSIFNKYPLLGVGLGHAGYFLPQSLNNYAYRLIEVRNLLFHSDTLLNIKSLWIRILAESGIIGFSFFFIWHLRSLLGCTLCLGSSNRTRSTAAWMGCFTLLAFLLEGFSLDTFALPYLWFSAGLSAMMTTGSQDE
ncbi:MAG: O-antigen ligase family protein, partial [Anaerolineaceae bacterium]|nr:O-antigen ligase family protein [Anaerolineaceae bacterium]